MAEAVIIAGKLSDGQLRRAINKLVKDVDDKMQTLAIKFDDSVQMMQNSLNTFANTANTRVSQIKQTFAQMGTTFQDFATAMERAARAAGSMGNGGRGGSGGNGGGGTGGTGAGANGYDTIGDLKAQVKELEKLRDLLDKYDSQLMVANNEIQRLKNEIKQLTKSQEQLNRETEKSAQKRERTRLSGALSMPTNTISEAERKLRRLEGMLQRVRNTNLLDEAKINRLKKAIQDTTDKIARLRQQASIPTTTSGVLGMSEKTLNDISAKMKAISQVRLGLDVNSPEISRLNAEYARLSKMQSEILGKNARLIESNNTLGRTFNYIRNRLAFTLTIGAFTGFVRQLYEVRGQYELLERSLGVLLNSFSKGTQIFNELNAMAIQSPFTLIELGTAAKQLTAYNFKANEVVDVTRRLADISSALGVPMERLVYNLGQIRAQTVLTARDARDFANAGLAIVPELAKYYTELEGKVVSTADVFDRMKKKAVSYNDTMAVLYKITDEGGKFFDFQAKQAGTLKVQLANLNLAWNNFLNDLGKSNQGLLTFPIQGLKAAFENWRGISNMITEAVVALGAYKVAQLAITKIIGVTNSSLVGSVQAEARANETRIRRIALTRRLTQEEINDLRVSRMLLGSKQALNIADYERVLSQRNLNTAQAMTLVTMNRTNYALHQALINIGALTQQEVRNAIATNAWSLTWQRIGISIRSAWQSFKAFAFTPTTGWMALLTIAMEIGQTWWQNSEAVKEFNRSIVESAKESNSSLTKFIADYSKIANADVSKLSTEEATKTWEAIREEIINSSAAGRDFVATLEQIPDVNQRVKKGFDYVNQIQKVHGALQEIDDDAIRIQQDWSKWWNLGLANDSMMENLDDLIDRLHEVGENYEKAISSGTGAKGYDPFAVQSAELEQLRDNLAATAEDMVNYFTGKNFNPEQEREAFNKVVDEMVSKQNMSTEQSLIFRMNLEREYFKQRRELFIRENEEEGQANYSHWYTQFGRRQSLEDEFLKWLSRNHRSTVQEMFGNMTNEEIAQIDWSQDKWKWWAINNAQEFSKQYNLSFTDLRYLVESANRYSIRIPVFFDFQNQPKSVYETLTEADQAADAAYGKIKRLQEGIKSGAVDTQKATKELTKAQTEYTDALAKGGKSKTAESDANKRNTAANKRNAAAKREQAKAESELQKVLKEELQIIDKVQAAYKQLTKAGASHTDALNISTSGYEKSVNEINKVFQKWGLEKFDLSKFAGIENPRQILNMLQEQLNKLLATGRAKPQEVADLEAQINKLVVSAKEFDLKAITDGLNNELGKIKEEYELGVELDANPELGEIFGNMLGIDKEELEQLPKDWNAVLRKMQESIDATLGKGVFNLSSNLDKGVFDDWIANQGNKLDDDFAKALNSIREYVNKVRLDETKKQIQEWDKLLEKYAEYEYKRKQILEETERELETARKNGASADLQQAISNRGKQELAKLNFDEFQKSPIWITATNDLSKLSDKALKILIERLVEFKRANKDLDPKQIQKINKALRQMRKEQAKDNPFKALSIAMMEAEERSEEIQMKMDEVQAKIDKLEAEEQDALVINPENQKMIKELYEELQRLGILKKEVSEIPLEDKVKSIGTYVKGFKAAADAFKQIADSTNDFNLQQTADAISDVIGNFEAAEQGVEAWGGWWGAIIGGVTDAIPKIMKWASGNAQKDYDIAQSQLAVKRLENTYKQLEQAASDAYGTAAYGAQKAMIANKELQLAQLEEQLRLEKSRKKKYQDQSAIADLEGQIIDLKNEINNATNEIVNDLLNISSKGDFAEQLVTDMIEAFKSGEDYMKVFEESFEDMVDNMIMKAIVSRLVGDWINGIWDRVQAKATESERAKSAAQELKRAEEKMQGFQNVDEDLYEFWKKKYEEALAAYNEAITPTPEDIAGMRQFFEEGREDFKNNFLAYMDAFGITFGQDKGAADLSALQQGIQGITEDTAGALEAYMNGVSQQVYLHSDLLTQIRDILVNFGGDVTIATNAQILLQLQQSFQIQMSIQSILMGWSSASGLAVRVEMV